MKKGTIEIMITDDGRIGTKLMGGLNYSDVIAGCHIVIAQVIDKMGITARNKSANPLLDVRHVG